MRHIIEIDHLSSTISHKIESSILEMKLSLSPSTISYPIIMVSVERDGKMVNEMMSISQLTISSSHLISQLTISSDHHNK